MNYLHKYLEFTTVEEGLECLRKAEQLRDSMVGRLYYGIVLDDCEEIARKLTQLEFEERNKKSE